MAGHESSSRAILYALAANFGIAVAKGGAAFYTLSGSMLAEAIHSLADCANQGLLFLGLARSRRAPTAEYPLGFGKAIYVWSFIVAILLFSMGGLFSLYEGVHKMQDPEPLRQAWVALVVLGVSIGLETLSTLGALREIKKLRGATPLWTWIRTSRSAELVVILGEDTAALLGLVLAFVFIGLASLTGNPFWDGLGSASIGVILLLISVYLVIHVKGLLIGRSAEPELDRLLRAEIAANPAIHEALNVITLQFGPDVMFAAKLRMDPALDGRAVVDAINLLERRIKEKMPTIKWSFIEPDIAD